MRLILGLSIIFLVTVSCANSGSKKSAYTGVGTDSVSAEIIKKYAPTPIDQSLSRKIQNHLDIRSPGMGMLHPDGKRLYFTWRVTGTPQVWMIDGPRRFPTQMTGGEDTTGLNGITKDGKFLVLSRDKNGEENPGLYLQSVDGGPLITIQHLPKIQTQFEGFSHDGEWIYFRSNDIDPASYAIYKYSLKTKQKELIFHDKGFWTIMDINQSGDLLLTKILSNVENQVYLLKNKEKNPVLLFDGSLVDSNSGKDKTKYTVLFTNRPHEYFVLTPAMSDFERLYKWKEGKYTAITKDFSADVSSVSISENRKVLSYSVNDNGYTRSYLLNAESLKEFDLPVPMDAEHTVIGWISDQGEYATFGIETATSPRANYVYDIKKNKLTAWQVASSPEVDTKVFSKASLEYYPSSDGKVQIPMFVRRPKQCSKGHESACPVIVDFHGGPEGQSVPGFQVYAQIFVDAGFIFVEPNVRGSDGYGQKWLNLDNGPKRKDVISDIESVARFIRKEWKVNKVGVTGGSYGGYSTFMAMTKFAGAYDAGVENVGMSNLLTFLNNTAPYRRALRAAEYGDPEKDKDALIELSAVTYINQMKAPLMMIQGVNDPRVPAGEAIQFAEHMQSKSIPHELILFADEGHGTSKRSNQVIQIGKTLEFFQKHLMTKTK